MLWEAVYKSAPGTLGFHAKDNISTLNKYSGINLVNPCYSTYICPMLL